MHKRSAAVAAAVAVLALTTGVKAQEFCVTCSGPSAAYRCLIGGDTGNTAARSSRGQFLCITEGDIGVLPAVYYRQGDGRPLSFRITGARLGADCSGAELDVALYACLYRTSSYIP